MATEIPVRLIGSNVVRNWPAGMDSASFSGNQKFTAPSRSGSAPPSMEGSSVAIRDLGEQQNSELDAFLENLNIGFERRQTEEQLRADPAYVAYYYSNVNLNPRIPPPLVSQENRRLAHHIGDNWRIPSLDDGNKRYLQASRLILSTHKEEHEDDRSPRSEFSHDTAQNTSGSVSGQSASPLLGCYNNIVDLIQEDFPRTPSPVYSSQPRRLCLTEQTQTTDACVSSPDDSMSNMVKSDPSSKKRHDDLAAMSIVSSNISSSSDTCRLLPNYIELNKENRIMESSTLPLGEVGTSTRSIINDIKSLKISNDAYRNKATRQNHHQSSLQSGSLFPVHLGQSQMTNQAIHSPTYLDHYLHSQSKLSSVEVQPVLQSAGIVPPLYATAAAFGAPYYPNLQPSNLFPPQFGIGGVTVNASLLPPFFSGYPSYNAIQVPYENSTGSNYNIRTSGVSPRGNGVPGYYGQIGVATQHSYSEPMYVSYFQHPSANSYASPGQFDPTTPRGSAIGNSPGFDPQKGSSPFTYSSDQSPQVLRSVAVNSPSIRKSGTASTNFYGNPANLSLFMQYPTSPLTSPVSVTSGRRTESNRSPGSSVRAGGAYPGWQSPRLHDKIDDSKLHSFLEELKSSKSRRYELSDIAGRIVEFSADQHGSRFIQQKLESCSVEEKTSVFQEVLPHASTLMTDVFGNYVIQKFFEHGSSEERKELANQLVGRVLPLSLQMYGCRVIQKALEVIELDQKTQLVFELDGHVLRCVRDQNGNHVIQKCIECVPTERIGFIISAFRGHVATLSMHPYGCRVIQRVLEHCTDELQSTCIVDEILLSACILAQDQYGNYVTQHVLERGKPQERSQIINELSGQVVQMSQHKFASNVIEKCLEYGSSAERELLIMEIIGQTEGNDNLLIMMKDQFANYVVQKILDVCTDTQRELLLGCIRSHTQALRKYTYGKHIVARVEQLCGDGEESPSSEF